MQRQLVTPETERDAHIAFTDPNADAHPNADPNADSDPNANSAADV